MMRIFNVLVERDAYKIHFKYRFCTGWNLLNREFDREHLTRQK